MVHRINVRNPLGNIELAKYTPLRWNFDEWLRVERWISEDREWHVVNTEAGFAPPEGTDLVLLRLPLVGITVGMGRQMNLIQPLRARPGGAHGATAQVGLLYPHI